MPRTHPLFPSVDARSPLNFTPPLPPPEVFPYNIVELLQANPYESTLVTAVVAGGLAGALSGKGPFTVFGA